MRVRAFTQDDTAFITDAQIAAESLAMNDLILSIYEDFRVLRRHRQILRPPRQAHR